MAGRGAPVGNQNAKKNRRWASALVRAVGRLPTDDGTVSCIDKGLDKLADKVVRAALAGDQWAIGEIANRMDGKPAQSLTVSGDEDGGPVRIERVERVIVNAANTDSESL
jgi:hypothetical protein